MDIALSPRKEGPRSWCCHLPNEEAHRKLKGESLYPGDRGSEMSPSYWVVRTEESGRWFSQWLRVWTPIIKKAGSPCRSAQQPHLHSSCFMAQALFLWGSWRVHHASWSFSKWLPTWNSCNCYLVVGRKAVRGWAWRLRRQKLPFLYGVAPRGRQRSLIDGGVKKRAEARTCVWMATFTEQMREEVGNKWAQAKNEMSFAGRGENSTNIMSSPLPKFYIILNHSLNLFSTYYVLDTLQSPFKSYLFFMTIWNKLRLSNLCKGQTKQGA